MKICSIGIMILWILVCILDIYTVVTGGLETTSLLFASLNIALAAVNATIWGFMAGMVKKTK